MTQSGVWTAYEAAAVTGGMLCARGGHINEGDLLPEESWVAQGISIDTRTIKPGDIFLALRDQRDGHDFVSQAFAAGASAAIVSNAPKDTPEGAPLLVVPDTLQGLKAMARAARDRCFGQFIAITGSAGKTSTKDMLTACLAPSGDVHAANKSFNNHLGVPLTLAQLPATADFAVFEIGMNHAGEITPLTQLVRPHVTIITTVGPAHLEFFDSVTDIAKAKAEIFTGLRPGGTVILPRDNAHYDVLLDQAKAANVASIITFGEHAESDVRMIEYHNTPAHMHVDLCGTSYHAPLGVTGRHQAYNALAALAAVHVTGGDVVSAIAVLKNQHTTAGRGDVHTVSLDGKNITLIDESYNANPISITAALRGLAQSPGRRIAVLGDMLELGAQAPELHAGLVEDLIEANVASVFCVGELMQHLYENLPHHMRGAWVAQAPHLQDQLQQKLIDKDVVMIKGSNASGVHHLVTRLCDGTTES